MQIDGSIKNLLQGVSQQDRRDRIDGQCTEQVNMVSDAARDLVRRPHSTYIVELMADASVWKYHLHNTGDEQYAVFFSRTAIRVFRLSDGAEQTVTVPSSAYLAHAVDGSIQKDLSAVTIGDYTIVANSRAIPAMDSAVKTNVSGAVIWVKLPGLNSQKYEVFMDGVSAASYTTPAAGTVGFGVNAIALALKTALDLSAFAADYTFDIFGEHVFVSKDDDTVAINVSATSDAGLDSIEVINNTTKDASELSLYHFKDKIIKITGGDKADENDFYMIYTKNSATDFTEKGVWRETVAAGIEYRYDYATMPHALIRTSNVAGAGKFVFTAMDGSLSDGHTVEEWLDRDAGDEDSNPIPPFIGDPITHVSSWQNRLIMLTGPEVMMSKTNSFFGFWNGSALTILDDDPIRLTNPAADYAVFYNTKAHNRHLLVFSDNSQFAIRGTSRVTPLNAAITLVSSYDVDVRAADPFAIGSSVLFPFVSGDYTGMRDFVTGQTLEQNIADSITEHIRQYIKGSPLQIVGSSNHNMVFLRTDDDIRVIYLYQPLWQGGERAQSAWSKWTFYHPIETAYVVNNALKIVYLIGTTYHLASMDLSDDPYPVNAAFNMYADYVEYDITPNASNEINYAPATDLTPADLTAVCAETGTYPGMELQVADVTGGVVTLKQTYGDVNIGVRYQSKYVPTMPTVKDENDITISTEGLMLAFFLISCSNSYGFDFDVESRYRDTTTQSIRTSVIGGMNVGEVAMESGTYDVAVLEDASMVDVTIRTDNPYPLNVIDIEYRGQYNKRGKRI